jgi:hypothetical protein
METQSVDQILQTVIDFCQSVGILTYITAGVIIAMAVFFFNKFFNNNG